MSQEKGQGTSNMKFSKKQLTSLYKFLEDGHIPAAVLDIGENGTASSPRVTVKTFRWGRHKYELDDNGTLTKEEWVEVVL